MSVNHRLKIIKGKMTRAYAELNSVLKKQTWYKEHRTKDKV